MAICPKCLGWLLDINNPRGFKKCNSCSFTADFREGIGMITKDELLMGRDKQFPDDYTQEISDNLDKLLIAINEVRKAYGQPMIVNSGWRPKNINESTPNAAKGSKHLNGLAVDIRDITGNLWSWCLLNLELLQSYDVYLEDRRYTPTWVHFQIVAPLSGKRIFVPSSNPPAAPEKWTGIYDKKFDS